MEHNLHKTSPQKDLYTVDYPYMSSLTIEREFP